MRSGRFDAEVKFVRAGGPQRVGQSRVPGAEVTVADQVPCRVDNGQGTERFANAENAATAPIVIIVRREPDLDSLDTGDVAILVETGKRYDIKSVRPYAGDRRSGGGDPRRDLEILAVGSGTV